MPSHYEDSLQRDIDRIKHKVAEMARLAECALEACTKSLTTRDRQLAYAVILRDRRIDELEKELDRLCLEFLIRQQPVARSLRFSYITIRVTLELERIGDYAESIARQTLKLAKLNAHIPVERFQQIASLSIPMLRDAVKAFIAGDEALARDVLGREYEVDALRNVINNELFKLRAENLIPLEALTPLMTIARRFERVSDQATNICEDVIYMVTGEYPRNLGGDTWRMVFIDDRNHCRSQMAEAIATALGRPQFVFASAGLTPTSVDPGTVEFMRGKGVDISHALSRSVAQLPNLDAAQIIVALSPAAKKAFPKPTKAVCLDWSLPDPSAVTGTDEEKRAAYESAYQFLREHITELCDAVLSDSIG
jgi:phosphate transport system protein